MSRRDHRILLGGAVIVAAGFIILGTLAGEIALAVYLVAVVLLARRSDPEEDELEVVKVFGIPHHFRDRKTAERRRQRQDEGRWPCDPPDQE